MREWQRLRRVCLRWRQIILESPRYLDLQLECSSGTPFRNNLSLWPAFPLNVCYWFPEDKDDLVAALEHPDRVRRIGLIITSPDVDLKKLQVMKVPFPALTHIQGSLLPEEILGGSTPCLQHLHLEVISFPQLPTLLLSAPNLISLELMHLPSSGYGHISPEAMVGALAALTRLRILCIKLSTKFLVSPTPAHGQRRPDLPMPMLLPALTEFEFVDDNEYLDDLVARIDAPRVGNVRIGCCVKVQTRQLSQFISRTANLSQFGRAELTICYYEVFIELSFPRGECHQDRLSLTILDTESNFPLPCMTHVLGQLVPTLSSVKHLSVRGEDRYTRLSYFYGPPEGAETWECLPLLRPFIAVEALHVSRGLAGYIGYALEGIGEEMVTEVLPALHLLCLEPEYNRLIVGSTVSERFLSLRQLPGRTVTIVNTQDKFEKVLGDRPLWDGVA